MGKLLHLPKECLTDWCCQNYFVSGCISLSKVNLVRGGNYHKRCNSGLVFEGWNFWKAVSRSGGSLKKLYASLMAIGWICMHLYFGHDQVFISRAMFDWTQEDAILDDT